MALLPRDLRSRQKTAAMASVLACAMLGSLSGCGIPTLREALHGRDVPDNFVGVATLDNSSQVGIDEFFDDPTLTSLIYEGLSGNQELMILAQDIEIANNAVLARRGAYLPFLSIGAGAGIDKPGLYTRAGAVDEQLQIRPGQVFPTPLPEFMAAANLTWQVDIWRQLRNARDAATLRYLATTEGRNYVVTRLVAEIAENYYGLMALDKRMENLDVIIGLQEKSLEMAIAKKNAAQGTELAVQRFQAEVRKNQSEKLIVRQQIIETENRINFLVGRFPEPVQRVSDNFFDLNLHSLSVGVPAELLHNRPDIRQAEQDLAAAGLDIKVARANFYPKLIINAGVGYDAFNPKYLFLTPESLVYGVAGNLVAPLINKKAIRAEYMNANARQLQCVYHYQRVVLNAFTEVVNRMSKVENYRRSIEIKRQQLASLEASVDSATRLFQAARAEYIDVLFAQRDLIDARMVLIETKQQELSAIVNTYQALGGGLIQFEYTDLAYVSNAPLVPAPDMVPAPNALPDEPPTLVPPAPVRLDVEE